MRFLDTRTLRFETVSEAELREAGKGYAILSHRWGEKEDEISFEDINSSRDISNKKAFAKLAGFCHLSLRRGYDYGWVETACINKADPTELAEAINSMYRWYHDSSNCIVYLEDVPHKPMEHSNWFTRGWTLQELISPKHVSFFDHDWLPLGTKAELLTMLSRRTGIPSSILNHDTEPSSCSIAQRMSWAAERKTTRVEDEDYSLWASLM